MLGFIGVCVAIFIGLALLGLVIQFWMVVAATVVCTLIGGPIGTVIGFVIGCVLHNTVGANKNAESVEDFVQKQGTPNQQYQSQHSSLRSDITIESLVPIIKLVCYFCLKQNGQWTTEKVQYVKNTFEDACETKEDLELLQNLLKSKDRNEDQLIQNFNSLRPDYELKQKVFFSCATALNYNDYSDDRIDSILTNFGRQLGLNESDFRSVINGFKRTSHQQSSDRNERSEQRSKNSGHKGQLDWAYGILGVDKNATEKEVQRAFRVKISQYHPDKNQNVTDAVQQLLNEKSRELQEARDLILANVCV